VADHGESKISERAGVGRGPLFWQKLMVLFELVFIVLLWAGTSGKASRSTEGGPAAAIAIVTALRVRSHVEFK
jgi:hypothetical protein